MFNQLRIFGGAVLILSLVLGSSFTLAQDKTRPMVTPEVLQNPASLCDSLRDVINLGARLFNEQGDQAGCYRVFQGGLVASRPFLANYPALLKQVDDALGSVEKMPKMNEKAFALRRAIDVVRDQLHSANAKKKGVETLPGPNPETKKKIEKPDVPPGPDSKESLKPTNPPSFALTLTGPGMATSGSEITYEITVVNASSVEAKSMTVTTSFTAETLRHVRSDPPEEQGITSLNWPLDRLPSGKSYKIRATFKTMKQGPITMCASVVTADGLKDEKCITTNVTAAIPPPGPKLEPKKDEPKKEAKTEVPNSGKPAPHMLVIMGPSTVKIGQPLQFLVKVTNNGSEPLDDVALEVSLSDGLVNPDRFHTLDQTLNPPLAAQETRAIPIDLVASKTGTQKLTVTAIVTFKDMPGRQAVYSSNQAEAVVTVQAK